VLLYYPVLIISGRACAFVVRAHYVRHVSEC